MKLKSGLINIFNRLSPAAIFFFGVAIIMVVLGLLTGFQHKILHVFVVCGNVISGLLLQWKHESENKDE